MGADEIQQVEVERLRPNNWFINRDRLEAVRKAWCCGEKARLPPVLVAEIDGELSLIDGHSRAYAAWENGASRIGAVVRDLDEIEGSKALYEHIHREGPRLGIRTIGDLEGRIVGPEEHRRLWVGYCERWLEENGGDRADADRGE